jgi:8-amino-7-oxononanoate synthase
MDEMLSQELEEIRAAGNHRRMLTLKPLGGTRVEYRGRSCVLFCSNDYLNLSSHPEVVEAGCEALRRWGSGAPASRMISGNLEIHQELEQTVSRFKGRAEAVLFPTGYMTNLAVLDALAGKDDAVYSDALNHASIVDACRLSRARVFVYPHIDLGALDALLAEGSGFRRRIVVSDAVFSMDGDAAPLPGLVETVARRKAWLVLDEAHATGVLGPRGRGIEEEHGLEGAAHVIVGTLGKALGTAGGFATGSKPLADLLRNRARTFLYTTAVPPPVCGSALAAFAVLERSPGLVRSLREKSAALRRLLGERGFVVPSGDTPIVPVVLGGADQAMAVAVALRDRGFIVTGIRPPTVPRDRCRIRVVVNAGHTEEELRGFADALARVHPPEARQDRGCGN